MAWSLFPTHCQAEKGEREEQQQQNVEGVESICRRLREARSRSLGGLRLLLSRSFLWRWDIVELSFVIFLSKVSGAGACRGRKGYEKLRILYLFLRSLTVLKVIEVPLDLTQSLTGCDLGCHLLPISLEVHGSSLDCMVPTLANHISE